LLKLTAYNKLESDAKEYVDHFHRTCAELADMIASVLDVSRLEAREMPLILNKSDLAVLAKAAVEPLRPLIGGRQFEIQSPADPVLAYCDSDLIRRVISNLLGNALKFTPEDGRICIAVSREGEFVRISVQDSGQGIPQEFHEKIFDKFAQADLSVRQHSSGLGLAFCKLAIERHGGRIGLESQVSQGSTFWFILGRVKLGSVNARTDAPG
jgi:signal transduction histidine kinase